MNIGECIMNSVPYAIIDLQKFDWNNSALSHSARPKRIGVSRGGGQSPSRGPGRLPAATYRRRRRRRAAAGAAASQGEAPRGAPPHG